MELSPYLILSHAHSINRWLVLITLLWAIASAFSTRGTMNAADIEGGKGWLPRGALPAFITTHVQLLLGLILYLGAVAGWGTVGSPYVVMNKEAWESAGGEVLRFYSVTHFSYMIVAVLVITVGYMVAKRRSTSAKTAAWILYSYVLGLLIILFSIPWPWRALQGGWY